MRDNPTKIILAAMAFVFSVCPCAASADEPRTESVRGEPATKPVDSVAAVVNGEIITHEELRTSAKLALDSLKEQYSGQEFEVRARAVLTSRLEQLIEKKLLLHEAKRAMTKEEIRKEQVEKDLDRVVKDLIDQAGSLLQLKKLLASKGETLEQARERRREELLMEEVLRRNVLPYATVSPREIREYYRRHIEEFSQKKQVKFRQILIKFSEYETKEQAREVAERLLQKLQAGASFESLAKENSRDPYAKEGGLWGNGQFVTKGTVLKEIDQVIFRLPVNELSTIVESPQGYHILRVEEIKPDRVIPFEEAQDQIRRALAEDRWAKRYNEYIAELKAKAYIEMK
jgi:parvulin-like peptidyl-prolyl isomerase